MSQEYAREWRICRDCRGMVDTDDGGVSSGIPDIATEEITTQRHMAQITANRGESVWVAGMRIAAWVAFAAVIIGGLIFAFQIGHVGIGILVFLGSLVVAFLSVAMLMIFLDMAQNVSVMSKDISAILSVLLNKDKK